MSRIGKKPVIVPESVSVEYNDHIFVAKNSDKQLQLPIHRKIDLKIDNNQINVINNSKNRSDRGLQGLTRTLVQNVILGITDGFTKQLEIKGVGYRAEVSDNDVVLNLGFSHPVVYPIPDGITVTVVKNTITITGCDKQAVGEVAASIRRLKPPEPYKGKGIKYSDEIVRRKAGKTAKAAEGAAKG